MEIYSGWVINVEKLLLNYCHPVGSLYISEKSTDPGTIFGGTWERIKDKFILAAGDSYSAGSTGGEATHTLTVSEMPSHAHDRIINGVYTLTDNELPKVATINAAAVVSTTGMNNTANTDRSGSFSVAMNPGEIVIGAIGVIDGMCSLRAYHADTNAYEFNYAELNSNMVYQRKFNEDVKFTVYYITI